MLITVQEQPLNRHLYFKTHKNLINYAALIFARNCGDVSPPLHFMLLLHVCCVHVVHVYCTSTTFMYIHTGTYMYNRMYV